MSTSDTTLTGDLLRLHAAVDAAGIPLPCTFDPRWISEDTAELHDAARHCAGCPVLDPCRAFGLAHPRELGVYGGLTGAQRNHQPTTTSRSTT